MERDNEQDMLTVQLQKQLTGALGPLNLAVSLSLGKGQVLALQGVSGAGKTSLLRMLAGLTKPDQGKIELNTSTWYDSQQSIFLPPQARKVGYVFQEYALFPHWSVAENLRFALPKSAEPATITRWLERVQLQELADRKPGTLSGGQQQRVALVRAMIRQPDLLLLDEPLAAQDRSLRRQLQADLRTLLSEQPTTTLLVSHDPEEIIRLADVVATLEEGRIQQVGTPAEIFGQQENKPPRLEVIRLLEAGRALVWLGGKLVPISLAHPAKVGDWVEVRLEGL
jgi:molybdate transport system ATP-binding protein